MTRFESWEGFATWLDGKGLFHMDMGLSRMEQALALIHRISYPIVQVLGTNGKGSTSAFLSSIAQAQGLNCGLFTSPHFLSPRERILLNGETFPREMWLATARDLCSALGTLAEDLTYFEFLTLLAVVLFRRSGTQLAIFEAGLGGAHDATSALNASALCYAPIALDHEGVLGPGLGNIARDKALAMHGRAPVFSAPQYPGAWAELSARARALGTPLRLAEPLEADVCLGLAGAHQRLNAAVATACWHWLAQEYAWPDDPANIASGLAHAFMPGRMQLIPPCSGHGALILDGAHNCHGVQTLLRHLEVKPGAIIFSALADKNWRPSLALLTRLHVPIFLIQLPRDAVSRAEDAAIMAQEAPNASVLTGADAIRRALDLAPAPTLICGSLYLLAEFYKLFPHYLEHPC